VNRAYAALLALAISASLSACSGGGSEPDWAVLLDGATAADLPLMVVPPEDLGVDEEGLVISGDSGPLDAGHIADDTIDPADTPDEVISSGFEDGYALSLVDESLDSLRNAEGLFTIGTSVSLYEVAEAAQAALEKERAGTEAFTGQDIGGYVLAASTFEENGDVGEAAYNYTLALNFADPESTAHLTVVQFRVGQLLATATIARGDEEDVASDVQDLAEELQDRIEGVMNGDIVE
jgi:hypothetical protein